MIAFRNFSWYTKGSVKGLGILKKLGLDRPELRAWAFYDWANSAFITTIVAAVLPIYFADVAAAELEPHLRTAYWGYTSAFALLVVSLISPVLGTMSDYLGAKKKFLAGFAFAGCLASALMFFVGRGDWLLAAVLFVIGNIGYAAGNVFYDSLLPHIAKEREISRVSTSGFAIGYIGGGLLLALNLAWIQMPEMFGIPDKQIAVQLSFLSVAVWWAIFSLPLFLRVSEPEATGNLGASDAALQAFRTLWQTFKEIRKYKHIVIFLAAYWLYMDGISTIFKMATIFGREVGIGTSDLIGALVLVQFLGIPFTFLFGPIADRVGVKNGIIFCLCVYTVICVLGYYMSSAIHFWMLACGVAMVQGGSQGLSRAIYARIIPKRRAAEFFGFYSVSARFAGILGPLIFGIVSHSLGSSRLSIVFLIAFFIAGIFILTRLDLDAAERAARQPS